MSEAREVGITTARAMLADLVNDTAVRGQTIYLTNRGRRLCALVPLDVAESAAHPTNPTATTTEETR